MDGKIQVNLFADEVQPSVDFYVRALGFTETFRTPTDGPPDHVEMTRATTSGPFTLGVARRGAGYADHGLRLVAGPAQCDVVFWCDDTDAAYRDLVDGGATPVREPHDAGPNRVGWVADPAGHLVSVVSKVGPTLG